MKIKFTCPKCGCHSLVSKTTHTESRFEELVGMDKNEDPIYGAGDGARWEGPVVVGYQCGEDRCSHEVAGDVAVSQMIQKGLKEGWLEKHGRRKA